MWLANQDAPQEGDIAFYSGNSRDPLDEAIMLRTRSKFVHVAVFRNGSHTIAALSKRILDQVYDGKASDIWRPSGDGYPVVRLHAGLDWLVSQLGHAYGYADVINQVLLLLEKDPVLLDKSEDCSDLAARFLWIAGVALPATCIDTNRVTPGMLYDALDSLDPVPAPAPAPRISRPAV